jgi:uncharacterized membrane protein YcjF (UPF0283 family)
MVVSALGLKPVGVMAHLPAWDPRLLWAVLALVVAILVGASIIAWADRWRKHPRQDRLGPNEELTHFRTLYEAGELSAAEFNRIHGLLTARIMREMDISAPAPNEPGVSHPQTQDPPGPVKD